MEDTQIQNIEVRLRRLEQLHIWGASIIAIGLVYVIFIKK